jgi:hypothetical protein
MARRPTNHGPGIYHNEAGQVRLRLCQAPLLTPLPINLHRLPWLQGESEHFLFSGGNKALDRP